MDDRYLYMNELGFNVDKILANGAVNWGQVGLNRVSEVKNALRENKEFLDDIEDAIRESYEKWRREMWDKIDLITEAELYCYADD